VKEAVTAGGIEYAAPEGLVRLDGKNQHTWKTVRIGAVRKDGLIDEVWSSGKPVQPDPYLSAYPWAKELAAK
jgi:urea transport system substrate-binding protein